MITKNFGEYSVSISTDPSYYGAACTQDDARMISATLANLIRGEFPGINVTTSGRPVSGPDNETCEEIRRWIEDNWNAAL